MHRSLVFWIKAAYRANPPEMAADASSAWELRREMEKLGKRWLDRFAEAAPVLAKWFATAAKDRSDAALKAALRKAGFSVRFTLSRAANDVLQATIGQNVGLIKSIAEQHLGQVQTLVMQSVQTGRDLGTLAKALENQYGVTRRRAATIAHHQNNIATATIQRVRQQELGITEAVWMHSLGGRKPRPSHIAFNGKTYQVAKGAYLDGEWVYPGQLINCRCVCRSVIPGL